MMDLIVGLFGVVCFIGFYFSIWKAIESREKLNEIGDCDYNEPIK